MKNQKKILIFKIELVNAKIGVKNGDNIREGSSYEKGKCPGRPLYLSFFVTSPLLLPTFPTEPSNPLKPNI